MYSHLCNVVTMSLFFISLSTANDPAACTLLAHGTNVDNLVALYHNNFCPSLQKSNFAANMMVYTPPVISLSFTPDNTTACSLSECDGSYLVLLAACQFNSHSVFGSGSLTTYCGTYNFTVIDTSIGPMPNATTTIAVSSIYSGTLPTISSTATKPAAGSQSLGSGAGRLGVNEFCGLMVTMLAIEFVVIL